jgi:hypothetical protein
VNFSDVLPAFSVKCAKDSSAFGRDFPEVAPSNRSAIDQSLLAQLSPEAADLRFIDSEAVNEVAVCEDGLTHDSLQEPI